MFFDIHVVNFPSVEELTLQTLSILHTQTFGRFRRPVYYRWQYEDCPEDARLLIAHKSGCIIGTLGVRRRWINSELACCQLMDMIVLPAYRGTGIFEEMVNRAFSVMSDADFWFAHANKSGMSALVKKMSFETVGRISVMVAGLGKVCEDNNFDSQLVMTPSMPALDRLTMTELERVWRFKRHPEYTYIEVGSTLFGSVYVKLFEHNNKTILDILTPFIGVELQDILRMAYPYVSACDYVSFWSAPHLSSYQSALSIGFEELEIERYLVGYPVSRKAKRLLDMRRWMVSSSDTEYI